MYSYNFETLKGAIIIIGKRIPPSLEIFMAKYLLLIT